VVVVAALEAACVRVRAALVTVCVVLTALATWVATAAVVISAAAARTPPATRAFFIRR